MNFFFVFICLKSLAIIISYDNYIYDWIRQDFINIADIILYLVSQSLISYFRFFCNFRCCQFLFLSQIRLRIFHFSFVFFIIMLTNNHLNSDRRWMIKFMRIINSTSDWKQSFINDVERSCTHYIFCDASHNEIMRLENISLL
jgi:hypothetical protein